MGGDIDVVRTCETHRYVQRYCFCIYMHHSICKSQGGVIAKGSGYAAKSVESHARGGLRSISRALSFFSALSTLGCYITSKVEHSIFPKALSSRI